MQVVSAPVVVAGSTIIGTYYATHPKALAMAMVASGRYITSLFHKNTTSDKSDIQKWVKKNFNNPDFRNPKNKPGPDWQWKGSDKGSWYNPKTDEYVRPDDSHSDGRHWDYRDPNGKVWRVDSNGNMAPK